MFFIVGMFGALALGGLLMLEVEPADSDDQEDIGNPQSDTSDPEPAEGDSSGNALLDSLGFMDPPEISDLGTADADDMSGSADSDVFSAADGDDQVRGGDGDDTVSGGTGADLIFGEDGADVLFGEAGQDDLNGGAGDDVMSGGEESDRLMGGTGNDALHGRDGHDTLHGGAGADTLLGGAGDDWIDASVDPYSDPDHVAGGTGADTIVFDAQDTVSGGGGSDQFIANMLSTEAGGMIEDFDPSEDQLVCVVPSDMSDESAVLSRVENAETPGMVDIFLGDRIVATLHEEAAPPLADIIIVRQE